MQGARYRSRRERENIDKRAQALQSFLDAVQENRPRVWEPLTIKSEHHPARGWDRLAEKLRENYAFDPELLNKIIGVKTRSGWATAIRGPRTARTSFP